jgi:hypothetical protein
MKISNVLSGFLVVAGISFAGAGCSVDVPDGGEKDSDEKASDGGSAKPSKGGGEKGADAASAGQQSGGNASAAKDSAAAQGQESEGVVCDASLEGVGWCADDANILFCSGDTWWLLDCTTVEADAFCGYDLEEEIVDCYVIVDDEDEDECADIDEECDDDADCCSEVCDVDGYCS